MCTDRRSSNGYLEALRESDEGTRIGGDLNEAFKPNSRLFTMYMLQEELGHLWSYTYIGAAIKWFRRWCSWAIRTQIKAVKDFPRSLKAEREERHYD